MSEVIKAKLGRRGSSTNSKGKGKAKGGRQGKGAADGDEDTLTTLSPEMAHHMQIMRAGVAELQAAGLYVPKDNPSDEDEDPYVSASVW